MTTDQCFNLGHVVKAIGLKGECSILLDVDEPSRYKKLESVFIEINKKLVPFFIEKIQLKHNKFATVVFKNFNSHLQVEAITGCQLFLPLSILPQLGENDFYYHELTNYVVVDDNYGELGPIQEITDYGHAMVATVIYNNKEILIPVQKEFAYKIDRPNNKLFVHLPEGLIDLYLSDQVNDEDKE